MPDADAFDSVTAEFDRLLDQSSLGSPVAQAIQALTPPEVMAALDTHLSDGAQ